MKRILTISLLLLTVILTVSADRRRMLMTRNVASAAYSPSDTANLFAWYKSDALVTNTAGTSPPAANDSVASWGDSSGNSRHVRTNLANATAPWFKGTAATGKSYGGIENQGAAMLSVGFTAQADSSIFFVWRNASAGVQKVIVDSTNSTSRHAIYKSATEKVSMYSASVIGSDINVVNPSWNIIAAVFNSAGSDALYTNGVAFTTAGNVGAGNLDGLALTSRYDGSTDRLSTGEYLGEVVIYNRALNATEIGQVNTYLNSRWSAY